VKTSKESEPVKTVKTFDIDFDDEITREISPEVENLALYRAGLIDRRGMPLDEEN